FAREIDDQYVGTSIAVEVANELEEVVRVAVGVEGDGRVDLVLLRERGPFVPVRAAHDVGDAIAVEVAVARALGQKFRGQDYLPERRFGSRRRDVVTCTVETVRSVGAVGSRRVGRAPVLHG